MNFIKILVLIPFIFSCASVKPSVGHLQAKHIYISPVTNRTPEVGLDVIFSKAADESFYSDKRVRIDQKPIPDLTLIVRTSVDNLSTFAIGFDNMDRVTEYKVSISVNVKVIKMGFKKPLYTFSVERYGFYDATGTPEQVESKRRACIARIARSIFNDVCERISKD